TLTHTVKAVFAAGADTATVTIATANDSLYEGDEAYTATLSAAGGSGAGYTVSSSGATASGTITDNDIPALSLTAASAATEGGNIQLTVMSNIAIATTAPDIGFTLTFAPRSSSGITGADFGGNYADLTHVLTELEFNGGEIAMVEIATVDDAIYEGNEDYTATLSVPTGGATLDTDDSEDGTLADNDDTPALSLTAASTATEGDNIQLTVTSNIAIATTAPDIGFTLTFAPRSSSGITGADFTNGLTQALTGVAFTGGSGTIAMVEIATVDDTAYEGNEDYTATLSAASAALYTVTSSSATASGTITDNDIPALSLTAASAATEGGNIQLTVMSNIAIATTAPAIGFTLTFASRGDRGVEGADFGGDYSDLTQP
ncbi:MAG: Calx-beta domain-containing protein, partial [Candidatus Eutrophobiaceae bacterium]